MTRAPSLQQSEQALLVANAERAKRRELRLLFDDLGRKAAALEAAHILADCSERYARFSIDKFLLLIPGVGAMTVDGFLRRRGWSINPRRRIGELTLKERWHIVGELERWGA